MVWATVSPYWDPSGLYSYMDPSDRAFQNLPALNAEWPSSDQDDLRVGVGFRGTSLGSL